MVSSKLTCAQAREIDLVDYLQRLGYRPQKVRGGEYWYLSPLRVENRPSFKVDRGRNIWYDHGLGRGGTMIDFGLQFHQCSLPELLGILSRENERSFSFHPLPSLSQKDQPAKETRLQILRSEPLQNPSLFPYILHRGISLQTAKKYFEQVSYRVHEKEFSALGFRNNAGGYELRSETFKGSSSPKDSTLIQGGKKGDTLAVFEGVFSFLSYLELKENDSAQLPKKCIAGELLSNEEEVHFLILNSLSFLEKRKETMENYVNINLYLDRDKAGMEATQKALLCDKKYQDKSSLYTGRKDLNDYLVHCLTQKQKRQQKKSNGWKKSL
ncbi:MAG: DNA primase [Chitinophagaceae bacterium]|nr:MAG: DNA primase [Chitinophagaceae bacterium]